MTASDDPVGRRSRSLPLFNNRFINSQQRRIERYVATSDALSFFNQLTSPELLDTLESTLPEHRE